MAEASVRRLGTVELGAVEEKPTAEEAIDPAPVVLWAGLDPAAVLVYRVKRNDVLRSAAQSFERVEGTGGPFPIAHRVPFTIGDRDVDLYDTSQVHVADVDGDGVDELVLVRTHGAVEVHSVRKTLFKHDAPSGLRPVGAHRARVGGRDVLFLTFVRPREAGLRAKLAGGPRSAVLRVDATGITRLSIGKDDEVLAVGALNLPRSQGVDELLVLAARGDELFLSRHKPDGSPIDGGRKVYVPLDPGRPVQFAFVAGSRRAVLFRGRQACFVEPEKPANWLHLVDLAPIAQNADLVLVGAADGDHPKLIVRNGARLYAVDQDGSYFRWNGGFVPAAAPAPFLSVPAPDGGHALVGVFGSESGGDEILTVHSRRHQLREPPFEQVHAAAERHLGPGILAALKRRLEPTLEGDDLIRDDAMSKERERKKVRAEPTTVEEWKRLLPDSYAAVVQDRRATFTVYALDELEEVRGPGVRPGRFREPDALRAWLAALDLPAETVFTLFRGGARTATFRAPGFLDRAAPTELAVPLVAFRARGPAVAAVVALEPTGDRPGERAALLLVRSEGR